MTGLGDEVFIRCPTCGYGLTTRKYAMPKECPLCHGSFDAEAAPAQPETEKAHVVEDEMQSILAEVKKEDDEPGERRTTLSMKHGVETGPLGLDTIRIQEVEPEDATLESKASAHESAAMDESLKAKAFTAPASTQGTRIEHAKPTERARAEAMPSSPVPTRMDAFPPPPASKQPTAHPQPAVQPARARGSLEGKVAPELVGRYADAYRAARAIIVVGTLIKALGVLFGLLVGIGLFVLAAGLEGRMLGGMSAVGFFVGLLLGGGTFAFFFVMGVVVSAQGQIIKATLDGAVSCSPFLTNAERAEAMSLS